jgi:hypothetical protein
MSVHARWIGAVPVASSWVTAWSARWWIYGPKMLLTQLIGDRLRHLADQADTRYRWAGSDQDFTASNMWSARTKLWAYAQ